MRRILILTMCFLAYVSAFAQTRQLNGVVVDAKSNSGIISATVKVKGQSTTTTTDADGKFSITVPAGRVVLEVSSIGFANREVTVEANSNTVTIQLNESARQLDEVVVTALGIRKERKALGYALSEVKGEELTEARSNNFMNNLVGKVAGLNVTSTATGAGGSSRVILRGNTSIFGNNQPLYVIDGIPIDNSNRGNAGEWGGRDAGDGIQMINPDEIESVSVLKGANAAALYGSRASTGVILITTKRGSKKKGMGIEINSNFVAESVIDHTDWQYQYGHGVNGVKPTTLDGANNINLNSWGAKLDGSPAMNWDGVERPYVGHSNNIKKFYNTGTNFTNSVTLYGSGDKMTYNFSVSDLDNKSIVPNSTLRRNNFSLNTTFNPIDKLSVNVSLRYIRERVKNRPRLSDSPGNANFTVGLMPTSWDVETFKTALYNSTGGENKFNANPYVTNPYWATDVFQQKDSRDRLIGAIEAKYNLLSWLYVRGRLGTDQYTRSNFEVTPTGTQYAPGGQINDQSTGRFREFNAEWLLGAQKNLGSKFGIDAFVGGNAMRQVDETQGVNGDNFFAPGFYHVSNLQTKNPYYNYSEKRINSLFGSAELSYNRYLYLTVTGRNDWYSTLSPENWSIFYPSVAASFILSDAVKLPSVFDYAKVRASWAKVGGDRDPYGLTLPYSLGNPYNGLPVGAIGTGTIPNKGLLPYEVSTLEFGVEARFLKNRLGIDLSIYNKKTTNDIVSSQISQTSGFNSVLLNVGEVSNKGVELLLNGTPVQNSDFSWDVSYNIGYNKGVVEKISDQLTSARIANARSLTAFVDQITGKAYGQVMAFDYLRDAKGQLILNNGLPQRGDLKAYGTGVAPTTMGLNNEFRYKSFFMSFLIDAKFGGMMYSGTNDFGTYRGLTQLTLTGRDGGAIFPGVNANGTPNTTKVDAQTYYQTVGLNISSEFIYKSDFIKLRQIILGYRIPTAFLGKSPIKGASVSLVARNVAILKKYVPNIDPESTYNSTNGQGLEWYGVPPVRSYGVNVNIKF